MFVFCHVERSEASLANGSRPLEAQKRSEIESLASRTSSAALQLRFAQNDTKRIFRFKR
jgi:hypothetical protein